MFSSVQFRLLYDSIIRNRHLNSVLLLDPLRSVQFSSVHRQLRSYAHVECSRAPGYIINGHGYLMQTISCTRR